MIGYDTVCGTGFAWKCHCYWRGALCKLNVVESDILHSINYFGRARLFLIGSSI